MTDQHPITPPQELVQEWIAEIYSDPTIHVHPIPIQLIIRLVELASKWGADQELEACISWMKRMGYWGEDGQAISLLFQARRPKPPSLKEQALKAAHIELDPQGRNGSLIIRALEALPDD